MDTAPDPTRRFSDRVEHYVKYRPGYPAEMVRFLREMLHLARDWVVADVGAGTGISSKLLLPEVDAVIAVEPNADMRAAAERELGASPAFSAVDGTAEATNLPDRSVDLVFCAQAFHWFDPHKAAAEFRRILRAGRSGGWVAVVWNERKRTADASPFLKDYENLLLEYGTDYTKVARKPDIGADAFAQWFGVPFGRATFANEQVFDFDGLRGRLLSSSYTPAAGHPNHDPMLAALRNVFDRHQRGGKVVFEYETELFYGKIL